MRAFRRVPEWMADMDLVGAPDRIAVHGTPFKAATRRHPIPQPGNLLLGDALCFAGERRRRVPSAVDSFLISYGDKPSDTPDAPAPLDGDGAS